MLLTEAAFLINFILGRFLEFLSVTIVSPNWRAVFQL